MPSNARMAARMCSGSVGHAATNAASSESRMPPSLVCRVRPVVRPPSSGVGKCLNCLGLRRGVVGFWYSLSRFES